MFKNFYESFSFEAQLILKVAFMLFAAFFVMLSMKGLLNLFDVAYAANLNTANSMQTDLVVGDYFSHFTVLAFSAYGFFFSLRKL